MATDSTLRTVIDSVFVMERDSVFVMVKGDTVYKSVTRYRDKYRLKRDTVVRIKEVKADREITREVEVNRLRWWQEMLMWIGGFCGVALVVWVVIKLLIKR